MKNKTSKKVVKKLKLMAKGAAKKTKVLMKQANKKAGEVSKGIQKEWKREEPQREKYKAEFKKTAKEAGARGAELLSEGLKNTKKIGGDVIETIKKDMNEISEDNK